MVLPAELAGSGLGRIGGGWRRNGRVNQVENEGAALVGTFWEIGIKKRLGIVETLLSR